MNTRFGISGDLGFRRRSELDLDGGKSLDHNHRTTAQRTGPERRRLAWGNQSELVRAASRVNRQTEAGAYKEEPVPHDDGWRGNRKVADSDEATRQHMQ